MFEYKKINRSLLTTVLRKAEAQTGVRGVVFEKDYWVCFVLNYLFSQCKWKDYFIFKGGTSLSKCFNLINRFSEDIDLIIDWQAIGYTSEEPWQDRSKTQQNKFNEESNKKTEEFIQNEMLPLLQQELGSALDENLEISIDEQDKKSILIQYSQIFASQYIKPVIKLEIGPLAEGIPSEVIKIRPDLHDLAPTLFFGDFIEIKAVLPERTFWEKAIILHQEANRKKESAIPARYARHYYDLVCIANSRFKDIAFENHELLEKVSKFNLKFYLRSWAKYENATIETIKLVPEAYRIAEIQQDYLEMQEMFTVEPPEFSHLVQELIKLENEIHNIKK